MNSVEFDQQPLDLRMKAMNLSLSSYSISQAEQSSGVGQFYAHQMSRSLSTQDYANNSRAASTGSSVSSTCSAHSLYTDHLISYQVPTPTNNPHGLHLLNGPNYAPNPLALDYMNASGQHYQASQPVTSPILGLVPAYYAASAVDQQVTYNKLTNMQKISLEPNSFSQLKTTSSSHFEPLHRPRPHPLSERLHPLPAQTCLHTPIEQPRPPPTCLRGPNAPLTAHLSTSKILQYSGQRDLEAMGQQITTTARQAHHCKQLLSSDTALSNPTTNRSYSIPTHMIASQAIELPLKATHQNKIEDLTTNKQQQAKIRDEDLMETSGSNKLSPRLNGSPPLAAPCENSSPLPTNSSPVKQQPTQSKQSQGSTMTRQNSLVSRYHCRPCGIVFSQPETLRAHQEGYCTKRERQGPSSSAVKLRSQSAQSPKVASNGSSKL